MVRLRTALLGVARLEGPLQLYRGDGMHRVRFAQQVHVHDRLRQTWYTQHSVIGHLPLGLQHCGQQ